jgi:iron complex transport system substrate-binding protein
MKILGHPWGYTAIACVLMLASHLPYATADVSPKPQRIVSLGLCTDQLALLMLERTRIASLTHEATNAESSYMAAEAQGITQHNATAEDIIRFQPDLVISTTFGSPDTVRILKQLGYRVELLPLPQNVEEVYSGLRLAGQWFGEPEKAEALIEKTRNNIADTQQRYANKPTQTIAIFSPNGYSIGAGTLENDFLIQAGYRNIAAENGIKNFQQISLETLLLWQPDKLLIDNHVYNRKSLAQAQLDHPALKRLVSSDNILFIPPRLRACPGPMTADVIEYLASKR